MRSITGSQAFVLGFGLAAWLGLIALLIVAPEAVLGPLTPPVGVDARTAGLASLVPVTAILTLLAAGVLRRWRWTFWVVMVAFLAGALRPPATLLELAGVLPVHGPVWYLLAQGGIGVVQLAIGLLLLYDWRRAGVWGAGRPEPVGRADQVGCGLRVVEEVPASGGSDGGARDDDPEMAKPCCSTTVSPADRWPQADAASSPRRPRPRR